MCDLCLAITSMVQRFKMASSAQSKSSLQDEVINYVFESTSSLWLSIKSGIDSNKNRCIESPSQLFHSLLISIVVIVLSMRLSRIQAWTRNAVRSWTGTTATANGVSSSSDNMNRNLSRLRTHFLAVFWLLRCAFWMSGPYFYAAYASKTMTDGEGNEQPLPIWLISQISLMGYAATVVFGPLFAKYCGRYGQKRGTIVSAFLFSVGSFSVYSNSIPVLFLGRALGGIGSTLLCSSPEAWLVSQAANHQASSPSFSSCKFLGETFGLAYAADSIVAIFAGQLAGVAANLRGPTGPFQLTPVFLVIGAFVAALCWGDAKPKQKEDVAVTRERSDESKQFSMADALEVMRQDLQIAFVGGVEACFEGAMYIFVLVWPPTLHQAIQEQYASSSAQITTPYGTIFSCLMACCMLGSTIFGAVTATTAARPNSFSRLSSLEVSTVMFLIVATLSLAIAAVTIQANETGSSNTTTGMRLLSLIISYFVFEACVGLYFPSISTLRSKFWPNSHRSILVSLVTVLKNALIVVVFLTYGKLGNTGALVVSTIALGIATVFMVGLILLEGRRRKAAIRKRFHRAVVKVMCVDAILHPSGFLSNLRGDETEGNICYEVENRRKSSASFSNGALY